MYNPERHVANGLDDYRGFFRQHLDKPSPRIVFEATPSYLYSQTAVAHLPDLPTSPRFLFILREPAAQIHSLYQYFRANWRWIPNEMSFSDFLTAVRNGSHNFRGNELARNALAFADYRPFLERWRDRLGPERMRVYLFEDMVRKQREFMMALCEWLDLEPLFFRYYDFPRENETYSARSYSLQTLNVAIRSKVPQGALYRLGRRIYRALNTTAPSRPPQEAIASMSRLRAEFADANACLASSFNLDLSSWEVTD